MAATNTSTKKAVGYLRVSTVEQAADGVSLDVQEERITAWAQLHDAEVIDVCVDAGMSGTRADNRPGLQTAIALAKKHKAALVVYSLSRMARSTKDTLTIADDLNAAGADLVSLSERIDTTSASGKMVFRMLAVLNEFERDVISERTRTAMQHKRSQNEYTGGVVPYGWRIAADGVHLDPHEVEQEIAACARELREAGVSLRKIGEYLTRKGMLPRSGGQWHAKTVNDLVRSNAA